MKKLGLNILCLALLAGCSSNEDVTAPIDNTKDRGVEVNFCSGVSTKAIIDGVSFPEGSEIGIYGLKATTATMAEVNWATQDYILATNLNNGKYTAMAVSGSAAQELKAEAGKIAKFDNSDDAALVFYGYYPYTADVTVATGAAPTIPVVVSTTLADTPDYLYTGGAPTAVTAAPINLTFKHAMSRLDFTIKKKNVDTPDFTIKSLTVKTKKGQQGSMSLSDGAITFDQDLASAATEFTNADLNIAVTSNVETAIEGARFLLIPDTDAIESVTFTLTRADFAANGDYTYTIATADIQKAVDLKKGYYTTLHLTYDPKDVNFTSTIQAMDEDTTDYQFPAN